MNSGKAKAAVSEQASPSFYDRLSRIKLQIQEALGRSPHGSRSVRIIGACKDQSITAIRKLAELGVVEMGQNYAQELLARAPLCMDLGIRWHFIGHLQANKVKHILPYISQCDSVDSIELAKRIARLAESSDHWRGPVPILLQVNLGHERQKSGLPPSVVESLFSEFVEIEGVKLVGLMSVPPLHRDPEKMRPFFRDLKQLFDRLRQKHPEPELFTDLSMGMSNDFEVAIEEGATSIRLGSCLFGPRENQKS